MKHGISPTTPRNQKYGRYVHISKPLAQRVLDPSKADENGYVKPEFLPLHLPATPGAVVSIVVAPVKGKTYQRTEPKAERPGRTRRAALAEMRAAYARGELQ